jgi:hypothetical protein
LKRESWIYWVWIADFSTRRFLSGARFESTTKWFKTDLYEKNIYLLFIFLILKKKEKVFLQELCSLWRSTGVSVTRCQHIFGMIRDLSSFSFSERTTNFSHQNFLLKEISFFSFLGKNMRKYRHQNPSWKFWHTLREILWFKYTDGIMESKI